MYWEDLEGLRITFWFKFLLKRFNMGKLWSNFNSASNLLSHCIFATYFLWEPFSYLVSEEYWAQIWWRRNQRSEEVFWSGIYFFIYTILYKQFLYIYCHVSIDLNLSLSNGLIFISTHLVYCSIYNGLHRILY